MWFEFNDVSRVRFRNTETSWRPKKAEFLYFVITVSHKVISLKDIPIIQTALFLNTSWSTLYFGWYQLIFRNMHFLTLIKYPKRGTLNERNSIFKIPSTALNQFGICFCAMEIARWQSLKWYLFLFSTAYSASNWHMPFEVSIIIKLSCR